MSEFLINDADLAGLQGKVVVLTGGSSGIGLATVQLLLSLGASVVSGDVQPPTEALDSNAFTHVKTDATSWKELVALFKKAKEVHGRIDHVFANAGIGPRANYLATDVDENGDPKEPSYALLDVTLKGMINTVTLAIFYLRQQPEGGSIVINGSSTGLQPLRAIDYSTAKHGVLGFGRGLVPVLSQSKLPIRVNTLAPAWTESQVLPNLKGLMAAIDVEIQPALAVAKGAVYMMADKSKLGDLLYIQKGKYKEIDASVLQPAVQSIRGADYPSEDEVLRRLEVLAAGAQA
ncbi:NAD(P)-binding protein [Xylariaceae sp. FL0016]|nr:NAD(P)-binding protein [Xylariaceae sp. FL0016]